MTKILSWLNAIVWGAPVLILIIGVGLYLSFRLGFPQITLLPKALRAFASKLRPHRESLEGTSSFQALCTALAATVGTGNLVGVAGAICLGGPGAIFWMWVCGCLGMVTKFAEAALAVRYRVRTECGYVGGPMYMMTQGLGTRFYPMAVCYCLFGVIAAFGVGNATQISAVVTSVNGMLSRFGREPTRGTNLMLGIALAIFVGIMLFGGAKRVGAAAEKLVPLVSALYVLMCVGVLIFRVREVPGTFCAIVEGAFSPRAVTGGMLGSSYQALRIGCSRGIFTNEAGMGTASIAHASAEVSHPAEQGLMGIMEVFLDTMVICTLTALVILSSGVPIPYGVDAGAELTTAAFASVYGNIASVFIAFSLCCFAIATILGWGLYGARCAEFLFGPKAWKYFAIAQTGAVIFGSVQSAAFVWQLAETVNGLMAIPNLITLGVLTPELARLVEEYQKSRKNRKKDGAAVHGGTYADFHQCQPL